MNTTDSHCCKIFPFLVVKDWWYVSVNMSTEMSGNIITTPYPYP